MDFMLFYGFLGIIISGYILWFLLPMGQGGGGYKKCPNRLTGEGWLGNNTFAFELLRHEWVDIHSWISVIVFLLVLLHLFLHRQWIVGTINRFKTHIILRQKAILERYIAVITLFILAAFQGLSGCVLWLIMPRGVGDLTLAKAGIGRTFWGLQRNIWVDLHAWIAALMVAIIVVHLIIHWRWIVNVTTGKLRPNKVKATPQPEITTLVNKLNHTEQASYLPRAGMLLGLIGAICFMVEILTFQTDWVNRYGFMTYLIPIPFFTLLLARKWPFIGGILMIILGVTSIALYLLFPLGIVWNQIGVWNELGAETIYTGAFVTLPLVVSGILYIMSAIYRRQKMKWQY